MTKFLRLLFSVPFYLVCLGFSTSLLSQKSEIREDLVPYVTKNSRPNWLKLRPNRNFTKDQFLELLNEGRDATEISRFRQIRRVRNRQGKIRYVFEQRYKGIPVEFHHWVLHEANNRIFLAQGRFLKKPANRNATTDLSPDQARIVAIDQIKAQTYAWEVPGMEAALKRREEDPTATYFPEGELVWMARNKKGKLRLAYKFDIYSTEPLARKRIYVNARNGNIIKEIDILHANCFGGNHDHHNHTPDLSLKSPTTTTNNNEHPSFVEATGIASYVEANNGVVTIQTKEDTEEGGFILRTDTYGPNNNQIIHTLNANEFFNYDNLTEFRDVDNNWNHDPAAVGAHWGAAKAYDYFRETFDRKSYDDARAPIYSLVHYGQNLVNAYWDGSQLIYGDGNGAEWSALTSLDIIAHEFTHGVTENNGLGGLVYLDDSGALNESFSDIFGTVVEFLHHPNGGNWMIGEDFDLVNNTGFRNMANPHLKGHPKTYLGVNWYDSAGDNGGVHFNSGVQNHWFYLLCEGGSGTNEFGHSYSIDPIGMEQAAAIAYYNLTTYMTPNSTYQDARDGALDAALFLYPTDLSIHDAVEAAWCAVGIGEGCGPVITINKPVLEEVVTSGKDYQVEWSSELLSATSKVKIEYTKDTGDNPLWHFINDNISNTGTYDWLVPADYSGTVMMRVTDDGDPAAGRVSNQDILGTSEIFTIEACLASESFTAPTASKKDSLITFSTNVTGDSYEWTIDGQVIGTDADLNHTFDQPGIYDINYIVNSTANGCYNEESRRQYVLNTNTSGFTIQVADVEGGGGRAYAQEILQTSDGGYLFTTLFSSMVFKLDAQGDRQWSSNSLPTPTFGNYRLATKELENGNYLVAMGLADNSGSAADDDLLLIEIDGSDGSILNNASTRLAINGRLKPHQIIVTDSSYIIGGGYQNQFEQDIFIAEISKTDYSLMNQHWLGANNRHDYYGELLPTSDGGFLMGWIQAGTYPEHFVMAKLDGNFQVEWKEGLFAFNNRPGLRSRLSLVEMPNCEGYMILATANEYANSALLKMNTLGNIVWAKRYSVPSSFSGQLIAFQDMTWDGHEGVTMIGINGTTFNSNLYPETVDYQILNVGFDGETNWQRKVTDLRVTIPSDANYNLLTTKILATNDGGYLLSVPGEGGGETHLIKTDSLGIDGCSITNTIINEEDISGSFTTDLEVVVDQAPVRTIQKIADYQFTVGTPFVAVSTPACGMVGDSLIAAFDLEEAYIPVDSIPVTTNLSRGATAYAYKVNGQEVASFDTIFANAGIYSLTLEATDGTTTTSTTKRLIVSDSISCSIACDFEVVQAYPIAATCPNSDDGQIYSEVSSAIGRTFKYALYNSNDSLLAIQPTGFFTNLATGVYQVKILADNDVSCVLEIEPITLAPKVDASPPSALCTSTAVNAAFVHAAVGIPYNHLNYVQEMQAAYDDDWHELTYEAVDPFKLFSDSYNYVYLEGSDNSADELEVFLTANLPLIENWVAAGNSLFLNAAPKEGDGMDLGFDGVRLVLGFYTSVNAVSPTLPMFQGPELPTATSFSGLYSLAAIICPPDMNATRILESDNGTDLLVEAAWGEGTVIFGSLHGKWKRPSIFKKVLFLKIEL